MSESLSFSNLQLVEPLLKALAELNYTTPTPIQAQAIPLLLEKKDLLGCAQTGTGKTAAFSLPILQNLASQQKLDWSTKLERGRAPQVLVLAPTRELALQIHESFLAYGKYLPFKSAVIFGGVGQGQQVRALNDGVDILVATPGRLIDLFQQHYVKLNKIKTLVLDEADRMLDMGFIQDIRRILPLLPAQRHNLFFSATMPDEVRGLSNTILKNPAKVEVTPPTSTAEKVEQFVFYVEKEHKKQLLKHVLEDQNLFRVIVFTRTKHAADRISDLLVKNKIESDSIHGDKSQNARQRALDKFKNNEIRVLIATDIMARGIDVDGVTHVINFEVSHLVENYIHRIGRTARAGQAGVAYSFCDSEEKSFVHEIEKTTGQKMSLKKDHPYHSAKIEQAPILSLGKAKAQMEAKKLSQKNPNDKRHKSRSRFSKSKAQASKSRGFKGSKKSSSSK